MLRIPSPPVTVRELTDLGTQDGRIELVDGTVVLRPWPTPLHSRVARRLARDLGRAVAPGLRVVERRPVEIGSRTLLVPDLAVVPVTPVPVTAVPGTAVPGTAVPGTARPAVTGPTEAAEASNAAAVPLLVVEISNPNKRRFDTLKLDLYRECGVASCWIVDPDAVSVEAYDLVDDAYVQTATARAELPLEVLRPFPVTVVPASLVDPPQPDWQGS